MTQSSIVSQAVIRSIDTNSPLSHMNIRPTTSRLAVFALGLSSFATVASASDVILIVKGTVAGTSGQGVTSGPFSNAQIGEAFTFVGGINRSLSGGPSVGVRSSTVDPSIFFLEIGNVSTTDATVAPGDSATVGNDVNIGGAPVDYLLAEYEIAAGGVVTAFYQDVIAADFATNDITLLDGVYVPSNPFSWVRVSDPVNLTSSLVCWIDSLEIVSRAQLGQVMCSSATPNSTGFPGELTAEGYDHVLANELELRGTNLPIGQFSMLVGSTTAIAPMTVSNSQGLICLGGNIARFQTLVQVIGPSATAPGVGAVVFRPNLQAMPLPTGVAPAMAGETWTFQAWFRDLTTTATSNLTDAVRVIYD